MCLDQIINSVYSSCTYIIKSNTCCWLIDVGDVDSILKCIGDHTIQGVFITHAHYDHIYGLPKLIQLFPACLIYTSLEGKEGLESDKFNLSRYHGESIMYKGPNVRILKDGDVIELFEGVIIRVMTTPGHDKSCLTYYTDDHVFTGDSYIPGYEVVTTFPRSNKKESKVSLEKIYELLKTRTIYPGHQK